MEHERKGGERKEPFFDRYSGAELDITEEDAQEFEEDKSILDKVKDDEARWDVAKRFDKKHVEKKELRGEAIEDHLTGLFNRRYLENKLPGLIKRAQHPENGEMVGIFLDLDKFKGINDEYGHKMGDGVLVKAAQVLKKMVREMDIVARVGGEEFMIVVPNIAEKDKAKIIERVEKIQEAIRSMGFDFKTTASIGVYTFEESDNMASFIENADKAMYVSKGTGRDKITYFDENTIELYNEIKAKEAKNKLDSR